jgi:hypothetical protein
MLAVDRDRATLPLGMAGGDSCVMRRRRARQGAGHSLAANRVAVRGGRSAGPANCGKPVYRLGGVVGRDHRDPARASLLRRRACQDDVLGGRLLFRGAPGSTLAPLVSPRSGA